MDIPVFLSKTLKECLNNVDINKLYEIRLRRNQPVSVDYDNNICYLGGSGITVSSSKAFFSSQSDLDEIIERLSGFPITAWKSSSKRGL